MDDFCLILRTIRYILGWTADALGEVLELSPTTITNMECNGKISKTYYYSMLFVLDCTLPYFDKRTQDLVRTLAHKDIPDSEKKPIRDAVAEVVHHVNKNKGVEAISKAIRQSPLFTKEVVTI